MWIRELRFANLGALGVAVENATKQVLLKMLAELEDLRASLGPLVAASSRPLSLAGVQDAKSLAKQAHQQFYDELRKEIDAL